MQIYLDCCCLNRPYDDLSSHTIRMEAEAVLSIIDNCDSSDWIFISSDVLLDEVLQISNQDKRDKVLMLYNAAGRHIDITDEIAYRAKELEQYNIKSYDALHLASAESIGADVLLTTDKSFINSTKRSGTKVAVKNPLKWLTEVLYDAES